MLWCARQSGNVPLSQISVDNSEWMRNGDFIPTRLQSQQDAVNTVSHMKTRQNVENVVGLLSLAEYVLLPSLPPSSSPLSSFIRLSLLLSLQYSGTCHTDKWQQQDFQGSSKSRTKGNSEVCHWSQDCSCESTSHPPLLPTIPPSHTHTHTHIQQLALKHRQNRNQKMRIIIFVGSPIEDGEKDVSVASDIYPLSHYSSLVSFQMVRLAKRLKKEKVNVDIVSFGEEVSLSGWLLMALASCSDSLCTAVFFSSAMWHVTVYLYRNRMHQNLKHL